MLERKVLHSWKEIARYTGRGVRTLERYEVQLSFPVHRPAGKSRAAVLAFTDEIDAWLYTTPKRPSLKENHPPKLTEEQVKNLRECLAVSANAKRTREMAKTTFESCLEQARHVAEMIQKLERSQAARHFSSSPR